MKFRQTVMELVSHTFLVNLGEWYAAKKMRVTNLEKRCYNSTDKVLLTFDDQGSDEQVRSLLNVLDANKTRAAFFINGAWAVDNNKLVNEISANNWVFSHGTNHLNLTSLDEESLNSEIDNGIRNGLIRPPYGIFNRKVRNTAQSKGLKIAYWSINPRDYTGISQDKLIRHVEKRLRSGACILLHIDTPNIDKKVVALIRSIRKAGFELCDDVMDLSV